MKKLTLLLIAIGLAVGFTAHAAPASNIFRNIYPQASNLYESGTSTAAWLNLTTRQLCLTGDTCRTTWPTGGAGSISTSTTAQIGKVPVWTGLATLGNGLLLDNGSVTGVNATSSTVSFNVQGSGGLDPFNVASSTGTSLLRVLANGNVGVGATTPLAKLSIGSGSLADSNLPLQLSTAGVGTEANIGLNKNGGYGFLLGYRNDTGSLGSYPNYIGGYMRQVTTDPFAIVVNNTTLSTLWDSAGDVFLGNSISSSAGAGSTMTVLASGKVGIGTTTPARTLTVVGDIRATGVLYDSSNSAGSNGQILQTTGTSYNWVATSTLGITSSLSGGTNGYVARWTGSTALGTGVLVDNGSVAGVNATSSTIAFNVQGTGTLNPFNVASSSGTSLFSVSPSGVVTAPTSFSTPFIQTNSDMVIQAGNGFSSTALTIKDNINGGNFVVFNANTATTIFNKAVQFNPGGGTNFVYADSFGTGLGFRDQNLNSSIWTFGIAGLASGKGYAIGLGNNSPAFIQSNASNLVLNGVDRTIGINTTSPTSSLYVQGTSTSPTLPVLSAASSTGAVLLQVNANGNVGIGTTTPTATLHVYGSNAFRYNSLAASVSTYTIATTTDNIIYVSTTTVASTLTLPACNSTTDQIQYIVKDKGGAAGSFNITLTRSGADTIDGATTKVINTNYGSTKVQCVSSGTWFVLP